MKSRLAGLKTITVSVPGVLLEEWTAKELEASLPFPTMAQKNCGRLHLLQGSTYQGMQRHGEIARAETRGLSPKQPIGLRANKEFL